MAYAVTASPWHGFEQPIDLWVSGLPPGMKATWQRTPLLPGARSVLILELPGNSLEKEYSMIMVGVAGRFVRSVPFTLTVVPSDPTFLPIILQE